MSTEFTVIINGEDMSAGIILAPHRASTFLEWNVPEDYIETTTRVSHAGGHRQVAAGFALSDLLDSLAATKVGRKAMLDALVRHES